MVPPQFSPLQGCRVTSVDPQWWLQFLLETQEYVFEQDGNSCWVGILEEEARELIWSDLIKD